MKHVITFLLVILFAGYSSYAQIVERVEAADGSIYEGYISEQIPGKQLSVYAERATLVIPLKSVSDVQKNLRKVSSFGESSRSWLIEHEKVDTVLLSSFAYDNTFYDDVIVLSKDRHNVIVVCLRPRTFVLDWKNVAKISKVKNDDPYGLRDVVVLKNDKPREGQIVEQVIGKSVVLLDDGRCSNINADDILSTISEPIDKNVSVFQQTAFLDRLVFEGDSTICGHIESKIVRYDKEIKILSVSDSTQKSIKMADIQKYQRYPNPGYRPYLKPVVDTAKSMRINGCVVKYSKTYSSGSNTFILDSCVINLNVGDIIKIELNNITCGDTVSLFETKVRRYRTNIKGDERNGNKYYAYDSASWPKYEHSIASVGKRKCEVAFVMKEAGVYFLELDKDGNGFVVEVKE